MLRASASVTCSAERCASPQNAPRLCGPLRVSTERYASLRDATRLCGTLRASVERYSLVRMLRAYGRYMSLRNTARLCGTLRVTAESYVSLRTLPLSADATRLCGTSPQIVARHCRTLRVSDAATRFDAAFNLRERLKLSLIHI